MRAPGKDDLLPEEIDLIGSVEVISILGSHEKMRGLLETFTGFSSRVSPLGA